VRSLGKFFASSSQRKTIQRLLKLSPSPRLAENNLLHLLDSAGAKALAKIPGAELPNLFRLLGSSAFLGDVLIGQGKNWPELFLHQIKTKQKNLIH